MEGVPNDALLARGLGSSSSNGGIGAGQQQIHHHPYARTTAPGKFTNNLDFKDLKYIFVGQIYPNVRMEVGMGVGMGMNRPPMPIPHMTHMAPMHFPPPPNPHHVQMQIPNNNINNNNSNNNNNNNMYYPPMPPMMMMSPMITPRPINMIPPQSPMPWSDRAAGISTSNSASPVVPESSFKPPIPANGKENSSITNNDRELGSTVPPPPLPQSQPTPSSTTVKPISITSDGVILIYSDEGESVEEKRASFPKYKKQQ